MRRLSSAATAIALLMGCSGGGGGGDISPFWVQGGIVVADLNGDDLTDVAVAKTYVSDPPPHPGFVDVYLRAAGGGFAQPVAYAVGSDPWGLTVGDVDGDDRPDLVVANSSSHSVSILLQNRSNAGQFKSALPIDVGGTPYAVAIGDIDGNDLADLAVALQNTGGGGIVLLQDSGPPLSFLSGIPLANGTGATSVAIGDLNHDDLIDVALNGPSINIFFQETTGPGFGAGRQVPAGNRPTAVAVADVNADGYNDILASNGGSLGDGSGATLSVIIQQTSQPGDFKPAAQYPVANGAQNLSVGRLGPESSPDVAVISLVYASQQPSVVTVLKNQAAGILLVTDVVDGPFSSNFITMGDVDGDGLSDLVVNDGPEIFFQNAASPGRFDEATPLP